MIVITPLFSLSVSKNRYDNILVITTETKPVIKNSIIGLTCTFDFNK